MHLSLMLLEITLVFGIVLMTNVTEGDTSSLHSHDTFMALFKNS